MEPEIDGEFAVADSAELILRGATLLAVIEWESDATHR